MATALVAAFGCNSQTPAAGGNDAGPPDAPFLSEHPQQPGMDAAPADITPDADPGVLPSADPDGYWLDRIGVGAEQLRRLCARQRGDLVSRRLCRAGVQVTGLKALYRALELEPGSQNVSIATNSSGLSQRTVSAINPRAFLSVPIQGALDRDQMLVVAFSRGEQLVELVAFDAGAGQLNFYLLRYRQKCNEIRCALDDVLSERTELDWSEWTLYDQTDLQDTPLDCLSCHQPDGPGGTRRLLMRDFDEPWFHWLPFTAEQSNCIDGASERPPRHLAPDLRANFERSHPAGYAGLDLTDTRSSDGHNLHTLVALFGGPPAVPAQDEPFVMDSRAIVDEWRCSERHDRWDRYRAMLLETRGLPVPYYRFDVLDRGKAEAALSDYPAFLQANRDRPAFEVLSGLLSGDSEHAIGARSSADAPAEAILRQACVRCHDGRAPAGSRRARFNVESIDPMAANVALTRILLPESSPHVMPPRRSTTLSAGARDKLSSYLGAIGMPGRQAYRRSEAPE
jgi:hypothetical protein